MAAPPPQDDDSAPEAIAFGIAAVDAALEGVELAFPATVEELADSVGDEEIPYDPSGNTMQLADALEETDRTRFESEQELMNELHPVFERRRARGGIGSWLRSVLPF